MAKASITNMEVKKNNRNRIYRYICNCQTVSNPDISYALKISLPTVTQNTHLIGAGGLDQHLVYIGHLFSVPVQLVGEAVVKGKCRHNRFRVPGLQIGEKSLVIRQLIPVHLLLGPRGNQHDLHIRRK